VSDAQKRREERFDWFQGHMERWLGSITQKRTTWLRQQLDRYPSTGEEWLAYRKEQQQQLLQMLRIGAERENLLDFLNGWMIERRGLPEKFAEARERIYADLPDRVMELDQMLTRDQRQHLIERIQFFEALVAGLILTPEVVASDASDN